MPLAGSEEPLCSGGPVVKQPCRGSEAWAGYSKSNQFFLRVAIVHRPLTPLHPLQQPDPPPTQPGSPASAPGRQEGQSFNEGAGGGNTSFGRAWPELHTGTSLAGRETPLPWHPKHPPAKSGLEIRQTRTERRVALQQAEQNTGQEGAN